MTIQQNIVQIKKAIHDAEQRYDRLPHSVSLLAVSKNQSIEHIQQAIDAGQLSFGENYVQEALEKIIFLNNPSIEWHFIGPLQSNKTRKIAENFSWVHSVSEQKILHRLSDQRPKQLPPLNICLQVNVDQDPNKSGASIADILPLAKFCQELPNLTFRGLMTIPTATDSFTQQRKSFRLLRDLYEQLRTKGFLIDTLSMGMSQDLEAAIAEGATIVRIGTAIFGARKN